MKLVLIAVLLLLTSFASQTLANERREGWTFVTVGGDTLPNLTIDSLRNEDVLARRGERNSVICIDSIAFLIHRAPNVLSLRSRIMGISGAVLAGMIFINSPPEPPDELLWSGCVYGVEFGGALLAGALLGLGVGYVIDRSSTQWETYDLTIEPTERKRQFLKELFYGEG